MNNLPALPQGTQPEENGAGKLVETHRLHKLHGGCFVGIFDLRPFDAHLVDEFFERLWISSLFRELNSGIGMAEMLTQLTDYPVDLTHDVAANKLVVTHSYLATIVVASAGPQDL